LKNHFKIHAEQAGLNGDFSIHSLRHSCGILHAKRGESAIAIMLWLRHRSIQSTQIYFEQVSFEEQDKKAAETFAEYL
jgi:integrase